MWMTGTERWDKGQKFSVQPLERMLDTLWSSLSVSSDVSTEPTTAWIREWKQTQGSKSRPLGAALSPTILLLCHKLSLGLWTNQIFEENSSLLLRAALCCWWIKVTIQLASPVAWVAQEKYTSTEKHGRRSPMAHYRDGEELKKEENFFLYPIDSAMAAYLPPLIRSFFPDQRKRAPAFL